MVEAWKSFRQRKGFTCTLDLGRFGIGLWNGKDQLSGHLRPFPVYPTLGERQTLIHETRIKLTVVIPVFNSKEQLCRCLNALNASTRSPDQIIVVDDSSADDSATVARAQGACVVPVTDGPRGPAVARNRGAVRATGDALVFLDADVTVHPDTLALFEKYLIEQPNIAAFFGSYDALPAGRGVVSRYKNLMHITFISTRGARHLRSGRVAARSGAKSLRHLAVSTSVTHVPQLKTLHWARACGKRGIASGSAPTFRSRI